jgi:hypothetical protein
MCAVIALHYRLWIVDPHPAPYVLFGLTNLFVLIAYFISWGSGSIQIPCTVCGGGYRTVCEVRFRLNEFCTDCLNSGLDFFCNPGFSSCSYEPAWRNSCTALTQNHLDWTNQVLLWLFLACLTALLGCILAQCASPSTKKGLFIFAISTSLCLACLALSLFKFTAERAWPLWKSEFDSGAGLSVQWNRAGGYWVIVGCISSVIFFVGISFVMRNCWTVEHEISSYQPLEDSHSRLSREWICSICQAKNQSQSAVCERCTARKGSVAV